MTNIPTELLRTLVAVVELRSFTKAAQSLGVTQPAVSAQIKRLQSLLGTDLLDKSAPGVCLTSAGDLVVNYARRLLSINDQILELAGPRLNEKTMRIGVTGDFTAPDISMGLASFRSRHPQARFVLQSALIDDLLREMRQGDLDVAVWVSATGPTIETPHCWTEELVWVRGPSFRLESSRPVPLVSYDEEYLFTRSALAALNAAGREVEVVYVGPSIAGLATAVASGLGVMAIPRNRANIPGVTIWEDGPLPKLPEIFCGIYVRTGSDMAERCDLADTMKQSLRLQGHVTGEEAERPAATAPA